MKFTVPAAALIAAALFVGVPRPAQATQPIAVFRKMKTAILHKAKDLTQLGIKVGKKNDGTIGVWTLINGDLIEVPPGGTYTSSTGNTSITVNTVGSSDLSSLSPEMQKQVKEALARAMSGQGGDGNVTTKVYVNGQESTLDSAKQLLSQAGIDFTIDIDLDEAHYSSIACGSNPNTLLLMKKSSKDRRFVVLLDPKSNLPKSVRLEQLKKGTWVQLKQSAVIL